MRSGAQSVNHTIADKTNAPLQPPLPANEIHIWEVKLAHTPDIDQCLEGLSPDEALRAASTLSDAYRTQFVQTRLILRELLGRYLQKAPSDISFKYSEHGKPLLIGPNHFRLEFNVSHTKDIALLAFTCGRQIGIDIELLDRIGDWRPLAHSSFSPAERAALEMLPDADRCHALTRGWVRKEAYTKARGKGFSHDFTRFSVSLEEKLACNLLLEDFMEKEASCRWWIENIAVAPQLTAALAYQGDRIRSRHWHFPTDDYLSQRAVSFTIDSN